MARLRARVSALQEEKEMMMGSLNALNSDLAQQPAELQHAAAERSAAASAEAGMPPPPPPPPPEKKQSAVDKKMGELSDKMKSFKPQFGKKKHERQAST